MLDLLVGIPLTIAAWKRGWKGWALLPMPLGFVAGIVAGAIIGSIATTEDDLFGMAILATVLIYIVEFGVLVTMIVKKREPKVTIGNQPAVAPMISSAVDNYRYAAYCTSCGQELHDSARFCRNCGQMARPAASGGLIANNQAAQPAR